MKQINSIEGFSEVLDIYVISKDGVVFSTKLNKGLKTFDNNRGYKVSSLKIKDERKWKKCYVHRLVALAYLDNPNEYVQVNHKDEDKNNNNISNLEWCSAKYNNNYGTKNDRMKHTRCKNVYVYDYLLNFVGKFLGMNEATIKTIGYSDTRALNERSGEYFFLDAPIKINKIIEINKKSRYQSVVVENINTNEKLYFPFNRKAREYFDNKVNVTDAIKKKWLVKKTYKIYELDYSSLAYAR